MESVDGQSSKRSKTPKITDNKTQDDDDDDDDDDDESSASEDVDYAIETLCKRQRDYKGSVPTFVEDENEMLYKGLT